MASWGGALRLQAIITGIVCASAVALAAPGESGGEPVSAGIDPPSHQDQRGSPSSAGIVFVLAPEWGAVYRQALRRIRDDIRTELALDGIRSDDLRISGRAIHFSVRDAAAIKGACESVMRAARCSDLTRAESMPGLDIQAAVDGSLRVQLTGFGLASVHDGFIAASKKELSRRLSASGFDDYLLTDDGGRIRLEIPPVAAAAHAGRQC